MKRLIYQVAVGKPSKLYKHCIDSVKAYADRIGAEHNVLTQAKLRVKPNVFRTNRSNESYEKYGGYLPIYEKENAFDLIDKYDQIAIIDADIYIRPDADNVFEAMEEDVAFGAVCEREMNCQPWYVDKIRNYSHMQYGTLHSNRLDFKPSPRSGFEFFNMGLIVLNCENFLPYLNGDNAMQFIHRVEFEDFVDGMGNWKWSTDQTLLNYFLKKYKIPTQHLDPKFNGLFTAVEDIDNCDFVHFFLKDKLPESGENIEALMEQI